MAEIIQAHRGQIFYLDYDLLFKGSMEKTRPVLIVQNDKGNLHSTYTIVATIKSDQQKGLRIQVQVPKGVGGLAKSSVVDCGHLYTVRQDDLQNQIGSLPDFYMTKVDKALAISLGLSFR